MKKFTLLLFSLLLLLVAFSTPVNADTISVCRTISSSGYHSLDRHILPPGNGSSCINITVNDVVLNLAGFSIWGSNDTSISGDPNPAAIRAIAVNNITIANGTLNSSRTGIFFNRTNTTLVTNVTIANSSYRALWWQTVLNSTISVTRSNNESDSCYYFFDSSNNTIISSNATNCNGYGFENEAGGNNSFSGNYVINTSGGFRMNNVAGGSYQISGGGGAGTGCSGTDNGANFNRFHNNNVTQSTSGFNIKGSSNLTIYGNNLTNNTSYGVIATGGSSDNNLTFNNVNGSLEGFDLQSNCNYTVSLNNVSNTNNFGMLLYQFSRSNVTYNRVVNTTNGLNLYVNSDNNTFLYNEVINNTQAGINLSYINVANNFTFTNITNNVIGVNVVADGSGRNNFTNNTYLTNGRDFVAGNYSNRLFTENFSGIQISANYTGNVTINSSGAPPNAPSGVTALSKYINVTNSTVAQFNLTMFYTDAEVTNAGVTESSLTFHRHNNATGEWFSVSSAVDANGNNVTATISLFSVFGLFGKPPAATPVSTSSSDSGTATAPPSQEENRTFTPVISVSTTVSCPSVVEVSAIADNSPVEGASVTLTGLSGGGALQGVTNSEGKVNFTLRGYGEYFVAVQKEGFAEGSESFIFNQTICPFETTMLDISGKIFCPNIFQVEVLYWGNNPVSGARVEAWLQEFGRIGARQGYRLALTGTTNENGLVNLTLPVPRVGIYQYTVNATARGFEPSESIFVAYEAGKDNCGLPRRIAFAPQPSEPPVTGIIGAIDDALPFDLPRGPRADIVMFFVLLLLLAVFAFGLYRAYVEFKEARRPPKLGSEGDAFVPKLQAPPVNGKPPALPPRPPSSPPYGPQF